MRERKWVRVYNMLNLSITGTDQNWKALSCVIWRILTIEYNAQNHWVHGLVHWLKLAFSMGFNRTGVILPSPEDRKRSILWDSTEQVSSFPHLKTERDPFYGIQQNRCHPFLTWRQKEIHSMGFNGTGVILPSPEDSKGSNFRNIVFSSLLEFRMVDEVLKPIDSENFQECYLTYTSQIYLQSQLRFFVVNLFCPFTRTWDCRYIWEVYV
jgi:hypothetical protein